MNLIWILLPVLLIGTLVYLLRRKSTPNPLPTPATDYPALLEASVPYYRDLPDDRKRVFAQRVNQFLSTVKVEGIGTTIDDRDRILVASSAIIPIFGFDDWYYPLTDVLLYPDRFNTDYQTTGNERNILGMMGEGGALQSTMVLSKPALHDGFANTSSKNNTGIHEFVHLLDKVDGSTDGSPEALLPKEHLKPWVQLIHQSIREIKNNQSDIDPYGMTNDAEFFAVVSEYFFKRPDLLHEKHPALFTRLEEIFRQHPLESDAFDTAPTKPA